MPMPRGGITEPMPDADCRRWAAYHEAGHAVIGYQLLGESGGAAVFPDGSGRTFFDAPTMTLEDHLQTSMAGPAVDYHLHNTTAFMKDLQHYVKIYGTDAFTPAEVLRYAVKDHAFFLKIAGGGVVPQKTVKGFDLFVCLRLILQPTFRTLATGRSLDEMVWSYWTITLDHVDRAWPAIEQVAQHLIEHGEVTGEQVAAICVAHEAAQTPAVLVGEQ